MFNEIKICSTGNISKLVINGDKIIHCIKQKDSKACKTIIPTNLRLMYLEDTILSDNISFSKRINCVLSHLEQLSVEENILDTILQSSIFLLFFHDWIEPDSLYFTKVKKFGLNNNIIKSFVAYENLVDFLRLLIIEFKFYWFVKNSTLTFDYFKRFCNEPGVPKIISDTNAIYIYGYLCYINKVADTKRILHHHGIKPINIKTSFNPHSPSIVFESLDTLFPKETINLHLVHFILEVLLTHELASFTPFILEMIEIFPQYYELKNFPAYFHPEALYLTGKPMKKLENELLKKYLNILVIFQKNFCPYLRLEIEPCEEKVVFDMIFKTNEAKHFLHLCMEYKHDKNLFSIFGTNQDIAKTFFLDYVPENIIDKKKNQFRKS